MLRLHAAATIAAALIVAPVLAQARAPASADAAPGKPVTLAAWSQRIGRELDKRVYWPHMPFGQVENGDVVQVKFNCTDSGRPGEVAILKNSGNRWLDRAALAAVQHVSTLHPLADGISHQQRYVATLLFATDYDEYDRQVRLLRASALKSNAWFKGPAGVALLDPAADPRS